MGSVDAEPSREIYEPSPRTIADIQRYCTSCWRNAQLHPQLWADATQSVMVQLMERIPVLEWDTLIRQSDSPQRRELIRAIDTVKKRAQRSRRFRPLEDLHYSHEKQKTRWELLEDLRLIIDMLVPLQREIVRLTLEGMKVVDIAAQMHLAVERVSDMKYKAVKRLRELLERGM
jgi:DNA-directed RNA polymerase specialized sigma24 family protein